MPVKCAAHGCKMNKKEYPERLFFKFPRRYTALFHIWLANINRLDLRNCAYGKSLRVCDLHFEPGKIYQKQGTSQRTLALRTVPNKMTISTRDSDLVKKITIKVKTSAKHNYGQFENKEAVLPCAMDLTHQPFSIIEITVNGIDYVRKKDGVLQQLQYLSEDEVPSKTNKQALYARNMHSSTTTENIEYPIVLKMRSLSSPASVNLLDENLADIRVIGEMQYGGDCQRDSVILQISSDTTHTIVCNEGYQEDEGNDFEDMEFVDVKSEEYLQFPEGDINNMQLSTLSENVKDYQEVQSIVELNDKSATIAEMSPQSVNGVGGETFYYCEECSYKSKHIANLNGHKLVHSNVKPFVCELCSFRTKRKQTLKSHIKLHKRKKFTCEKCTYKTLSKKLLNSHGRVHSEEKPFLCEVCSYRARNLSILKLHIQRHSKDKLYACDECSFRTSNPRGLKGHKERIHSSDKSYRCEECPFMTNGKYSMEHHMFVHGVGKSYSCNQCSHKARSKYFLKVHTLRRHSSERPYCCNQCSFRAKFKHILFFHLRTHTDERPYACSICSYRAKSKHTLKSHKLIHSSEYPFACIACAFRTKREKQLIMHTNRVHSDEKPFVCKLCPYKGSTSSSFKKHIMLHTGEKPLACKLCSYRAIRYHSMKVHMMTHTGERPYACETCEYRAREKVQLHKHMQSHKSSSN